MRCWFVISPFKHLKIERAFVFIWNTLVKLHQILWNISYHILFPDTTRAGERHLLTCLSLIHRTRWLVCANRPQFSQWGKIQNQNVCLIKKKRNYKEKKTFYLKILDKTVLALKMALYVCKKVSEVSRNQRGPGQNITSKVLAAVLMPWGSLQHFFLCWVLGDGCKAAMMKSIRVFYLLEKQQWCFHTLFSEILYLRTGLYPRDWTIWIG